MNANGDQAGPVAVCPKDAKCGHLACEPEESQVVTTGKEPGGHSRLLAQNHSSKAGWLGSNETENRYKLLRRMR